MADRTIVVFSPTDAECKTTVFPAPSRTSDASGARPILLFDAAADEAAYFSFIAPRNITGTLKAIATYAMVSATSGNIICDAAIEAITDGDSMDTDSTESLDSVNTSSATAVPGTAGNIDQISITLTNADSITAGDYCRLRWRRVGSSGSDTATGDLALLQLEIVDNGG